MVNVTLFSQIISKLDTSSFKKLVKKYQTDKHQKGFTSWSHLVSMLFCQFAKSQSIRDISNGLRSATSNLNHLGVGMSPSKSTLSYQNKHRNWELFRDYYYVLLKSLGQQVSPSRKKFRIKSKIFLLDASTITLCLSLFDWARFNSQKGAIKMHTLLDYDGHFPAYVNITDGKVGDNRGAYDIPITKGSVVVADRYYNDYSLLNFWHSNEVLYVVRSKKNLTFTTIKELELPEDKYQHLLKDEIVEILTEYTRRRYPKKFRRIAFWDDKNEEVVEILTNQMSWTANTISELYRARWQIEVFFRDIKQQLHIKSFIGTTPNAVMIQLWTAMITILILKVLKKLAKYPWYLSNLIAFIRLNLFVKVELQKWLDDPFLREKPPPKQYIQGVLF